MKKLITILLIVLFAASESDAQLFKKMLDRTADKISDRVEDKIVEGISTELANRAVRPLDRMYDEMFRQQYKEQYGKEWDDEEYENDEERTAAMNAMWGSMFGTVDLPESYSFDKVIEIEVYDYGSKKANKMKMIVNQNQPIFGMEQEEDGTQIVVYDFEKDIVTIFNESEKTAMAVPNVMKLAKAFSPQIEEEMKKEMEGAEISEIKSKKILDCQSKGYKVKTEEEESEFYICMDAEVSWGESYGKMMKQLSPNFYENNELYSEFTSGMLMRAKTKRKKDKKESKWETKKISSKNYTIKTADYKLTNNYN